jgi:hypothetical protein
MDACASPVLLLATPGVHSHVHVIDIADVRVEISVKLDCDAVFYPSVPKVSSLGFGVGECQTRRHQGLAPRSIEDGVHAMRLMSNQLSGSV